MTDFNSVYARYKQQFETALNKFCCKLDCKPDILAQSLKYSLNLGGKRIRPVLMFAVGELLNVSCDKLADYALAIELIHTYSLIHDDLPEMDNDDFRRGQPSNHKVFGTGNAVLAGDGLLNTAYSVLLKQCVNGPEHISAASFICECAGIYGMIAGQSADLLHENDEFLDKNVLDFIYENKTSKLLTAAVVIPDIISGGKHFSELKEFGKQLGYLFQITDDILDVEGNFDELGKSLGKDAKEGKYTAVKMYGLSNAKLKADILLENCLMLLESFNGDNAFLKQLVTFVRQRVN